MLSHQQALSSALDWRNGIGAEAAQMGKDSETASDAMRTEEPSAFRQQIAASGIARTWKEAASSAPVYVTSKMKISSPDADSAFSRSASAEFRLDWRPALVRMVDLGVHRFAGGFHDEEKSR